ncbi:porin [Alphaproteobacteria bacterium LSUCC0684]
MRKVLLATTALATIGGVAAIANADVSLSGDQQWRYISLSDDNNADNSDSDFTAETNVYIAFSTTTDNGLTFSMSQSFDEDGVTENTSSISGDFGTISFVDGSTTAHAASDFDVTSVGIAGGHGDAGMVGYAGTSGTTTISGVQYNEALIRDPDGGGVLRYHSPSFGGLTFGVSFGHLEDGDDNTSTSYGAMYSGSMGDIGYKIGVASYDGQGSSEDGQHIGANITYGDMTFGIGSSSNKTSATSKQEDLSYSVNYKMNSDLTLNIGRATSENDNGGTKLEANNTSIGVAYTIAPGLTATLNSHNFEYKSGGSVANDGQAIQSEIKMSW